MTKEFFIGNTNNVAKKPSKIFVGNSNNIAKEVKSIFIGNSSNQAVKIYPIFPDIYQKCEYIYNSGGTQWINTGIKPNSNTELLVEAMRIRPTSSSHLSVFQIRDYFNNRQHYYGLQLLYNLSTVRIMYDSSETPGDWHEITNGYSVDKKYIFDFAKSGGNFYIDGSLKYTSTRTFASYSLDVPLFGYIDGMNNNNVEPADEGLRIYHFQAWQDNVMIRDMYPCYLKSNNLVAGMYDIVKGDFYGNDGGGYFYRGPDVN